MKKAQRLLVLEGIPCPSDKADKDQKLVDSFRTRSGARERVSQILIDLFEAGS